MRSSWSMKMHLEELARVRGREEVAEEDPISELCRPLDVDAMRRVARAATSTGPTHTQLEIPHAEHAAL